MKSFVYRELRRVKRAVKYAAKKTSNHANYHLKSNGEGKFYKTSLPFLSDMPLKRSRTLIDEF